MLRVSDPQAHGNRSAHRADPLTNPGRGSARLQEIVAVERTHRAGDGELLRSDRRHQAIALARHGDRTSFEPALRSLLTRRELDSVGPARESTTAGPDLEGTECFDEPAAPVHVAIKRRARRCKLRRAIGNSDQGASREQDYQARNRERDHKLDQGKPAASTFFHRSPRAYRPP